MYWADRKSFSTVVLLCLCVCACAHTVCALFLWSYKYECDFICVSVCVRAGPPVLMMSISMASLMAAYRVTGRQRRISPIY